MPFKKIKCHAPHKKAFIIFQIFLSSTTLSAKMNRPAVVA
jgi:hypothetical protein